MTSYANDCGGFNHPICRGAPRSRDVVAAIADSVGVTFKSAGDFLAPGVVYRCRHCKGEICRGKICNSCGFESDAFKCAERIHRFLTDTLNQLQSDWFAADAESTSSSRRQQQGLQARTPVVSETCRKRKLCPIDEVTPHPHSWLPCSDIEDDAQQQPKQATQPQVDPSRRVPPLPRPFVDVRRRRIGVPLLPRKARDGNPVAHACPERSLDPPNPLTDVDADQLLKQT